MRCRHSRSGIGRVSGDVSGRGGRNGDQLLQVVVDDPYLAYAEANETALHFVALINIELFHRDGAGNGSAVPSVDIGRGSR